MAAWTKEQAAEMREKAAAALAAKRKAGEKPAEAAPAGEGGGVPWGAFLGGLALVLALGGTAVYLRRRALRAGVAGGGGAAPDLSVVPSGEGEAADDAVVTFDGTEAIGGAA